MKPALICGIDEVGRGCLAGPIIAVAALFEGVRGDLPPAPIVGLKDSKTFTTAIGRQRVYHSLLRSPYLLDFGIGCIWPDEIDRVGIDEANALAFFNALDDLKKEPDHLWVDGVNPVRKFQRHCQTVEPKADSKYWMVSAASILAKVIRDNLMGEYHYDYPQYDWKENSGYGTPIHCRAIKKFGATPF